MRAAAFLLCCLLLCAPAGSAQGASHADAAPPAAPAVAMPAPPPDAVLAPEGSTPQAIRATLALPTATWYNDMDGDKVFDTLEERFLRAGPVQPVIVTFREGVAFSTAMADATRAMGQEPRMAFAHVGGFYSHLDHEQVQALAALDAVRQIEWSQPGEPELDLATADTGVDAVQDVLPLPEGIGLDGSGVTVAVMDTGIDGEHKDLAGQTLLFIDWSAQGEQVDAYDSGIHGTHVASIVAGTGAADADYRGVAPGAKILGYQITPRCEGGIRLVVLSVGGSCDGNTKANAIASVDHMIEHKEALGVRISTISFGFGITVDGTDALELAMDRAFEAGILPFKSTGNSGPEMGTVTIPGGARGIVSVGSMFAAQDGGFRLSSFSSRGPTEDGRIKPDLVAPGHAIMAAHAGTEDGHISLSGTSMASPFAAGTAALVLQADPSLTAAELRDILFATAHDWGGQAADVDYGHGRIDALRAVQEALARRAVREGLDPFVDALQMAGPDPGDHAFAVLTSNDPALMFEVAEAQVPVGITILHNGTAGHPVRATLVRVIGPDGEDLGGVPTPSTSRQITFSFVPRQAGTHVVSLATDVVAEEVLVDVHAGLGLDLVPFEVPEVAGRAQAAAAQDAPPGALLVVVVATLCAAVAVARRDPPAP